MNPDYTNSQIIVDLPIIKHNIELIRRHIGPDVDIMFVAKSNGYGHGLVGPAKYIYEHCGVNLLATSMVSEAIQLREAGVDGYILIMAGIPYAAIPAVIAYDLVVPAFDLEFLTLLSAAAVTAGKTVRAHLKVDTGLHRLGVTVGAQLADLISLLKTLDSIQVDGIYSHLANPREESQSVTNQQIALFDQAIEQVEAAGISLKYKHLASSDPTLLNKRTHYNLVRPAALCYGYNDPSGILGVRPAITWKTFVADIREVEAGERFSYYSNETVTSRRTRIAILGFGAGDGYVRNLVSPDPAKNGIVTIAGRHVPVLATNMDQAFVDITDVEGVRRNDPAYVLLHEGEGRILMDDLARIAGTSTGHIQCSLGARPERVYLSNNS